nr:hypothetical protein [Tanacetum cinerariifolium]
MMVLRIPVMFACVHAKMSALALNKFPGYPFFADGKGPFGLLFSSPALPTENTVLTSFFGLIQRTKNAFLKNLQGGFRVYSDGFDGRDQFFEAMFVDNLHVIPLSMYTHLTFLSNTTTSMITSALLTLVTGENVIPSFFLDMYYEVSKIIGIVSVILMEMIVLGDWRATRGSVLDRGEPVFVFLSSVVILGGFLWMHNAILRKYVTVCEGQWYVPSLWEVGEASLIEGFPVRVCERKHMGCPLSKITVSLNPTTLFLLLRNLGDAAQSDGVTALAGPVLSKAYREGCRASRGGFSWRILVMEMKNYNMRKRLYRRPHVNSGTRASGWQRRRNYNNQLDEIFLEGLKNLSLDRTTRTGASQEKDASYARRRDIQGRILHYDMIGLKGDFLVEGTDKGNWNKICTTCIIRRIFEDANKEMTTKEILEIKNAYLEKYFQEFITSTTNKGRDSADTNLIKQEVEIPLKSSKGKRLDNDEGNLECIMWAGLDIDSDQDTYSGNKDTRQLTVNSFEGFIRFMKLANNNKVVLKHREIFRECFESMLKWFHNTYINGDITKLMPPPTIGGYEIWLFDLYKLVKCFCGYERLNYKKKWDEVSLGFGFSGLYGLRLIYVHYLLIPETYFEVAKVGLTSTDDYIRENCLVAGNNEVSMMSEQVNEVDIEGTSRDWEQITSIKHEREGRNFIS